MWIYIILKIFDKIDQGFLHPSREIGVKIPPSRSNDWDESWIIRKKKERKKKEGAYDNERI